MSLETKHYVATAADIKALADAAITGEQSVVVSRGAYLRALVATTQAELGAEPRQRAGRSMRLPKSEIPTHMDAARQGVRCHHRPSRGTRRAPAAALQRWFLRADGGAAARAAANAPVIPGELQEGMDALMERFGPALTVLAVAVSLERLAAYREHTGSLAPVVALRTAAQDLRELNPRV